MEKKELFGRVIEVKKKKEDTEDHNILQSAGGSRKFQPPKTTTKDVKPVVINDYVAEPDNPVIPEIKEESPSEPKEQLQSEANLIGVEEERIPKEEPPKRTRRRETRGRPKPPQKKVKPLTASDERKIDPYSVNINRKKLA
jgi:hypothetical protein